MADTIKLTSAERLLYRPRLAVSRAVVLIVGIHFTFTKTTVCHGMAAFNPI